MEKEMEKKETSLKDWNIWEYSLPAGDPYTHHVECMQCHKIFTLRNDDDMEMYFRKLLGLGGDLKICLACDNKSSV